MLVSRVLFVTTVLLLVVLGNTFALNVPPYELSALQDLYDSAHGRNWSWRSTGGKIWEFGPGANPCNESWQGISCDTNGSDGFVHVTEIDLSKYNMNGTIPNSIGNLTELTILNFFTNFLSGTIPYSIGNLTQLVTLYLEANNLHGTLPISLTTLPVIVNLYLARNGFTGTLSDAFGDLKYLEILGVNQNRMSGTVPESLGGLSNLQLLVMKQNSFEGTIPASLGNLTQIQDIDLYHNRMIGSIPNSFRNLHTLQYLDVYHNHVTGTLPEFLGQLSNLQYLYLGKNLFTGTVPENLGNLQKLLYLYINDNSLTGTIPKSLSNIPGLISLLIYSNNLHGSLRGLFNGKTQYALMNVLMGYNQFTGTIPEDLFRIPTIEIVELVSNCLEGPLPLSICNASSLQALALDGLQTAETCRDEFFPGLTSSYKLNTPLDHGLPTCLFQLPQLGTLHLSGNGLTGKLPDDMSISPSLVNLSLSHNVLSGSIPKYIQTRVWTQLDLAYNRIDGVLVDDFAPQANNASLILESNRLSGTVPRPLWNAKSINILDGNEFNCNFDETDMPKNDPNIYEYQCGSNLFNASYISWLTLISLLFIISLVTVAYYHKCGVNYFSAYKTEIWKVYKWMNLEDIDFSDVELHDSAKDQALPNYNRFRAGTRVLVRFSLACTAFSLFVLLPLYLILSEFYSTHSYQYAYLVALVFLSGEVPFALAFTFMCVFWIVVAIIFVRMLRVHEELSTQREKQDENINPRPAIIAQSSTQRIALIATFAFVDFAVVIGINVAFVEILLYGGDTLVTTAQFMLGVFKVAWNLLCSKVAYYLAVTSDIQQDDLFEDLQTETLIISLINNIFIPCAVIAIVSTECFYDVFSAAPSVGSTIQFRECLYFNQTGCMEYITVQRNTGYDAPFVYSYQCSSSILTSYAPTFMYVSAIVTFGIPLIRRAVQYLNMYMYSARGTFISDIIYKVCPLILKPQIYENQKIEPIIPVLQVSRACTTNDIPRARYSPYFNARQLFVNLYTYLALQLTFGTVFPPLALALTIAIIATVFYSRMEVRNFIDNARGQPQENKARAALYIKVIDDDCQATFSSSMLLPCLWLVLATSCLFYTLFFFDILGDAVGFQRAYWLFIVVPLISLCILVSRRLIALNERKIRNMRQMVKSLGSITSLELTKRSTSVHSHATNGEGGSEVSSDLSEAGGGASLPPPVRALAQPAAQAPVETALQQSEEGRAHEGENSAAGNSSAILATINPMLSSQE